MASSDYSAAFLAVAAETNKQLLIAVEIAGLSTVLTSGAIYKKVRYGDPVVYGQPDLVYGGFIPYGDFSPILSLDKSSLTLQQKIEPEQGRASVTMLSLAFIDLNGFMTQLIAPGILIPDILGAQVIVRLGFPTISYPEDYTLIFRGRVSAYNSMSGMVTLQLSDPNMVRRQQLFYTAHTAAASAIADTDTTIYVNSTQYFNQQILGPNGQYDPAITTYLQINDEVIMYPPSALQAPSSFVGVVRGQRGTSAVAHDIGATVSAVVDVQDHMIDMALKYMLSGWQGPYLSNLKILSFVQTNDTYTGIQNQGFVISKDAVQEYGMAPGDYVTITGATNSGNNVTAQIVLFLNTTQGNNLVCVTNYTFTQETVTSAVFSVRSQYDTYPDNLGLQMPGYEVDIAQHQYIKATFMSSEEYSLDFYVTAAQTTAKSFIESELYLPFGCYSLTRQGQLSMQLTHAPIADERLQVLDKTNVLNPQNINPQRGINNRKFFNEIDLSYDVDDAGDALTTAVYLSTNSLNIIGISSVLPVTSQGMKSTITTTTTINRIYDFVLSRYQNGAVLITLDVNFATGVQIEAGDVVQINDNGFLQISNFLTGQRNLGSQLFEVIDRSLSLSTGKCSIQVVSGIGAEASDRYATFGPASILTTGTTQNLLVLQDSYKPVPTGQEVQEKWVNYMGLRVKVYAPDFSQSATAILSSVSSTVPNAINVTGISIPASAGPFPGWIMQQDDYSTSTDPLDQAPFKISYVSWSPSIPVVSGLSATAFTVPASAIGIFQIGIPVLVHDLSFSNISAEANVLTASTATNIVTVSTSLGFTPSAGMITELNGFQDDTSGYRYL